MLAKIKHNLIVPVVIIAVFIIFIFYLENEGIYVWKKVNLSNEKLLCEFCEIDIMPGIKIDKINVCKDFDSHFFSHSEYIEATLMVPYDSVDKLFPENIREYDKNYTFSLTKNQFDNFMFSVLKTQTVKKWFSKTQRTVNFIVTNYDERYACIFVYVDKLGWILV